MNHLDNIPPGLENDPNAPYNLTEDETEYADGVRRAIERDEDDEYSNREELFD